MVASSSLPVVLSGWVSHLLYTPTSNIELLPDLCGGVDSFNVTGRNLNMSGHVMDGPVSVITVHLDCSSRSCVAGESSVASDGFGLVCITCDPGSYNLDANSSCKSCPTGGICDGGTSLAADIGYWYYDREFYQCEDGLCCTAVCNVCTPPFAVYV